MSYPFPNPNPIVRSYFVIPRHKSSLVLRYYTLTLKSYPVQLYFYKYVYVSELREDLRVSVLGASSMATCHKAINRSKALNMVQENASQEERHRQGNSNLLDNISQRR